MSRGLRQKEKSRLGEVARLGSRWAGAVMGPSLRLGPWWEEGSATYLACGGPHAHGGGGVLRGVGIPGRGGPGPGATAHCL